MLRELMDTPLAPRRERIDPILTVGERANIRLQIAVNMLANQ